MKERKKMERGRRKESCRWTQGQSSPPSSPQFSANLPVPGHLRSLRRRGCNVQQQMRQEEKNRKE